MKKIDVQKIKETLKTHAPTALASAVAGGAVTLAVAKNHYLPTGKNVLFLSDISRKLLAEGKGIVFDLEDFALVLNAVKR